MNKDKFNLATIQLSYLSDLGLYTSIYAQSLLLKANIEARKKLSNCRNYIDPPILLYKASYCSFISNWISYIFLLNTLSVLSLNPDTTPQTYRFTCTFLNFSYLNLYTSYTSLQIAYTVLNS